MPVTLPPNISQGSSTCHSHRHFPDDLYIDESAVGWPSTNRRRNHHFQRTFMA